MELQNIVGSLPDDRDYPYTTLAGPFAASLDLKPEVFEIEDQLTIGSCTCNASVSACEMLGRGDYSRLFPYWVTRNTIEDSPGAEGASLRDAIRALYHWGTPLEAIWPYDIEQVNAQPNVAAYADAVNRRVTRYERIVCNNTTAEGQAATRTAIKSALSEGLPVVFASHIGAEIRDLKGPWQMHFMQPASVRPVSNSNTWIGNNAMLIIGYDEARKVYLVQNSWGPQYGDGGFLGYPFWALACDIMEAWVIRGFQDVMISPPIPDPAYWYSEAEVVQWYHNVGRSDVAAPIRPEEAYWRLESSGGPRAFYGTVRDICQGLIDRLQ